MIASDGEMTPPCGVLGCGFKDTVVHYPGSEKFFNELQDVAVSDMSRDTLHNQFVRDVIKESFDIGIQHELVTVVGIFNTFSTAMWQ